MERLTAPTAFRLLRATALLLLAGLAVEHTAPLPALAQSTNAERLTEAEGLGWSAGPADAPVTVVEFTDVSCPYCASFHDGTRAALRDEFVANGQVRWITLSYVSGLYPNSSTLSAAAECAGQQGHFEEFMGAAYEGRASWIRSSDAGVTAAVERFAGETGLEIGDFASCLLDASPARRLERIGTLARELGVRGTPTWFVDGFPVMGDLPLEYARQFITDQLPG